MSHYTTKAVLNPPHNNIYEQNISLIEVKFIQPVNKSSLFLNNYIATYYTDTSQTIKYKNDLYNKFTGIHTITSQDEFNLCKNIGYIPITKKYLYKINNIIDTTNNNDEFYTANITVNIFDLLYTKTLSLIFLNNTYVDDTTYTNELQFNITIPIDVHFLTTDFTNYNDFTNYINNDFKIHFINHLNTILYDDMYTYNFINNNNLSYHIIVNEKKCNTSFIITLDNINYYKENLLNSNINYNIINTDSSNNIINKIEIDDQQEIFYNNIIFTKQQQDSTTILYKLIILDNILTLNKHYFLNDYYYLFFSNNQFFNSYSILNSCKLSNILTEDASFIYTHKFINNNYQSDNTTIGYTNNIDLYIDYFDKTNIKHSLLLDTFQYSSIADILNKYQIIPISNNIYYYTYLDNIVSYYKKSIDYDKINLSNQQITPTMSSNNTIVDIVTYNNTRNNVYDNKYKSTITFNKTETDTDLNYPTKLSVFNSNDSDIKQHKAPYPSQDVGGLFSFNNFGNYEIDEVLNFHSGLYNYANLTYPIYININDTQYEHTIIFFTGNTGFMNTEFEIGNYYKINNGNIILYNNFNDSTNINFLVPIELQSTEDELLLHILTLDTNKNINYEVHTKNKVLATYNGTLNNIEKLNLSILQLKSVQHDSFYKPKTLTTDALMLNTSYALENTGMVRNYQKIQYNKYHTFQYYKSEYLLNHPLKDCVDSRLVEHLKFQQAPINRPFVIQDLDDYVNDKIIFFTFKPPEHIKSKQPEKIKIFGHTDPNSLQNLSNFQINSSIFELDEIDIKDKYECPDGITPVQNQQVDLRPYIASSEQNIDHLSIMIIFGLSDGTVYDLGSRTDWYITLQYSEPNFPPTPILPDPSQPENLNYTLNTPADKYDPNKTKQTFFSERAPETFYFGKLQILNNVIPNQKKNDMKKMLKNNESSNIFFMYS